MMGQSDEQIKAQEYAKRECREPLESPQRQHSERDIAHHWKSGYLAATESLGLILASSIRARRMAEDRAHELYVENLRVNLDRDSLYASNRELRQGPQISKKKYSLLEEENSKLTAQLAHRHILGKAYEVSAESIRRLAGELEETREELAELKEEHACLRSAHVSDEIRINAEKDWTGLTNELTELMKIQKRLMALVLTAKNSSCHEPGLCMTYQWTEEAKELHRLINEAAEIKEAK